MSEAVHGKHSGDAVPSSAARVFLGLGSNLGDRAGMLAQARTLLDGPGLRITAASSVYEMPPWGVADQPRYLNQVLDGRTTLSPRRLLHRGQEVETRLGRVRSTRWGPRTIDVDILLYGDLEINEPDLVIPHPQLAHRAFVLVPLAELAAAVRVPGGDTIGSLLQAGPDRAGVSVYRGDQESPARRPMRAGQRGAGALGDLGTHVVGRHIRWHDSLPSTNDLALRLAEIPVPEGTVIIAEEQTAGRGRLGRAWASPRGGVWLSVILSPGLPMDKVAVIGLVAGIAVAQAIRKTTGLLARLKWPNDVLVEGQKVVGVLAEAAPGADWVVVGIGINANLAPDALPAAPGYPVTSLQAQLGHMVDREALIRGVLRELDQGYAVLRSSGISGVLRRWREMAETLGRPVRVEMSGATIYGTAVDIDEAGALLVRLDNGAVQRIVAGDVGMRETGS